MTTPASGARGAAWHADVLTATQKSAIELVREKHAVAYGDEHHEEISTGTAKSLKSMGVFTLEEDFPRRFAILTPYGHEISRLLRLKKIGGRS